MRILPILLLIGFAACWPTSKASAQITGTWQNNEYGHLMTVVFNADGSGQLDGEQIKYSIKGTTLTVTTLADAEEIDYSYTLSGNVLTVTGGDLEQPLKLTKVSKQTSSRKTVPQELVGKWCWVNVTSSYNASSSSDACITLNADGTYTYYAENSMSVENGGTNSQTSDRGAWWVEGNRIFYDSPSRGQGSYALEKRNHPKNTSDPMIVLDGEPFVTQIQRAPWR